MRPSRRRFRISHYRRKLSNSDRISLPTIVEWDSLFRMTRTAFSDSTFTSVMFAITGIISKPMMRKQNLAELTKMKSVIEMQIPSRRR